MSIPEPPTLFEKNQIRFKSFDLCPYSPVRTHKSRETQMTKAEEEDKPYVFSDDFFSVVWEVKVNKICKKTHGYEKGGEGWIFVMRK